MMNNHSLRFIYWNANGIRHKLNKLRLLTIKTKIVIKLLAETNFNPETPLKLTNVITYRTDNSARVGSSFYCGTDVLINRCIIHRQITLNTKICSTFIEIFINNDTIRVSSIYKTHRFLDTDDLDQLTIGGDWFIATGDLNSKQP